MSTVKVNTVDKRTGSTLTLGGCGTTVTLGAGATQSGFGRTGTVDWCTTAKTAPFTGVSGKGYFVNTTSGAITVTLPATPTAGDIISIKDYARTAGTNAINICRNGSKMDGACASSGISADGDSTTLIYVDATKGWTSILDNTTNQYGATYITATGGTITTSGDYKIHTFTSSGTFTVCSVGNPAGSDTVSYMVIAGGGGADGGYNGSPSTYNYGGGGGGAGGFREGKATYDTYTSSPIAAATGLPVSATTYPITIGAGGTAGVSNSTFATNGSNSVFSTITSAGGGRGHGGGCLGSPGCKNGLPGGSGGGGGAAGPGNSTGGTGNTPPTTPAQGTDGGQGSYLGRTSGGGGGGAIGAGSTGGEDPSSPVYPLQIGAAGGAGASTGITGSTVSYAGGGGGGSGYYVNPGINPGPATAGGGAGASCGGNGTNGTANTGGGGGGTSGYSGPNNGGAGGSGIVIIRYKYQ